MNDAEGSGQWIAVAGRARGGCYRLKTTIAVAQRPWERCAGLLHSKPGGRTGQSLTSAFDLSFPPSSAGSALAMAPMAGAAGVAGASGGVSTEA